MKTHLLRICTSDPTSVRASYPTLPGQNAKQVGPRTVEVNLGISRVLTPEQIDYFSRSRRETKVISFGFRDGEELQTEDIRAYARRVFACSKNVGFFR